MVTGHMKTMVSAICLGLLSVMGSLRGGAIVSLGIFKGFEAASKIFI